MGMDLLRQLRDIHYPSAISMWPLAVGWYVVIGCGVLGLIILGYYCFRTWKKNRLKRLVLQRLDELQQDNVTVNVSAELSVLLKRCALAKFPRHQVAGLHSEEWLLFLDKTAMTNEFTQGPGRILVTYPYLEQHKTVPAALFHLISEWVKKNL